MQQQVEEYISRRYPRWLDYAKYHCTLSGLNIEPVDVLNDTMLAILESDPELLNRLRISRRGDHTELDFYVLHIIKTNIHSSRSRSRYIRGRHVTDPVDWSQQQIPDVPAEEYFDLAGHYEKLRRIFNELEISENSRRIFEWKFFEGRSFADWQGDESLKYLYATYNRILSIIFSKIRKIGGV